MTQSKPTELFPRCLDLTQPLAVTHDNYLLPCCMIHSTIVKPENRSLHYMFDDALNLSNVDDIAEILNSPQWRRFLRYLIGENVLKQCYRSCSREAIFQYDKSKHRVDKANGNRAQQFDRDWTDWRDRIEALIDDYVDGVTRIPFPNIDLCSRCRLECPLCARQQRSDYRNGVDLPFDTIPKLLKYYDKLNFCGTFGDPIYHPDFLDMLKYLDARSAGELAHIEIHTNGTGKKLAWWEEALSLCQDRSEWIFALDGLSSTNHIYRVNSDWDEVWRVMKLGVDLRASVSWQFIRFSFNEHQVEEAKELAGEHGIKFVLVDSSRSTTETEWMIPAHVRRTPNFKKTKTIFHADESGP